MSKLLRFADSEVQCWSRVDLPSGQPIFISIARTGLVVKVSRTGLFGSILFRETEVARLASIMQVLSQSILEHPELPQEMRNLTLRLVTSAALQAENAASLGASLAQGRQT